MKVQWTGRNDNNKYTSISKKPGKTYKYKMRYCKLVKGQKVWSSWTAVKSIFI